MKVTLKIVLCLILNVLIFKVLFLSTIDRYTGKSILIKQVYSKPGYQYWSVEDGGEYCKDIDETTSNTLYQKLNSYSDKKTTVVLFKNVGVIDCLKHVKTIATQFHTYGLKVAFFLDLSIDNEKIFTGENHEVNDSYLIERYKSASEINDWVDYVVVDNAMQYFTFDERRHVQALLRDILKKPYLGFRFTKEFDLDPESSHPHRTDKQIKDFLPKDDDGDFIITDIKVPVFRRTLIFISANDIDKIGNDGEFLSQ